MIDFSKWWLVTLIGGAGAAYGISKVLGTPTVSPIPGGVSALPPGKGAWPSVIDGWYQYSIDHEGFTPFLYCDTLNLVTTGIGNLVDSGPNHPGTSSAIRARLNNVVSPGAMAKALALPFKIRAAGWTSKNPVAGRLATQQEIADAWTLVKNQNVAVPDFSQNGGGAYAGLTNITLDMDGIKQLFNGKTNEVVTSLAKTYPNFPVIPADAQRAMLSMSWAMGAAFYPALGFKAFKAAVDAMDWNTTVTECQFKGGGSLTNPTSRNAQNALMFKNASAVKAQGLDASKLWFPASPPLANV